MSEEQLAENRCDFGDEIRAHPLDDDYHRARSPQWDKITAPLLSAANWGGQGLHPRGNFEGFVRAASKDKWLEAHGIEHWTHFYTDYGRELQRSSSTTSSRARTPAGAGSRACSCRCAIRARNSSSAHENEWPIARTQVDQALSRLRGLLAHGDLADRRSARDVRCARRRAHVHDAAAEAETEITGPVAAKLFVSSSTADADLFLVLRVFSADMKEIVFMGAIDPHTPIAQGWLRASHRKLDPKLTLPYRPYHTHDENQPLTPGKPVELDIELWPTWIVVPAGYRVALTVRGKDYEYGGGSGARLSNFKNELMGCGPFLHDDPVDRPKEIFGGQTTLHFAGDRQAYLLLPIVPAK